MTLKEIGKKYAATDHRENHGDKGTTHSYLGAYEKILSPYKERGGVRMLEVGVAAGLSLRMWQEWLGPDSLVCGIDPSSKWFPRGLTTEFPIAIGHSNVPSGRAKVAAFTDAYDVIVDDGDHNPAIQLATYWNLSPLLAKGGVYIIEDITNIDAWRHEFEALAENVEIVDLRLVKDRGDDVLVVIR